MLNNLCIDSANFRGFCQGFDVDVSFAVDFNGIKTWFMEPLILEASKLLQNGPNSIVFGSFALIKTASFGLGSLVHSLSGTQYLLCAAAKTIF